jgi:glycine oxidase
MNIAVVGSGVVGSLVALWLKRGGANVSLLTASQRSSADTCSYAAGGMLSPVAEAVYGSQSIAQAGWDSVNRWSSLLETLKTPVLFGQEGSIVFATSKNYVELNEWIKRLSQKFPDGPWEIVEGASIETLEPGITGSARGVIYLKNEGFVDSRAVLAALMAALQREQVSVLYGIRATRIDEGVIEAEETIFQYDMVIDCRGLGAHHDVRGLRGVRGEALLVRAPDVSLNRPIRVLHPRYPIYVVPRERGHYYIGATVIESESVGPISVQSLLEILAGLYHFHPGFRYAEVVQTIAHVRPALDDHEPRILPRSRLIQINGLYRHGFLLGPILAESVANLAYGRPVDPRILSWITSH